MAKKLHKNSLANLKPFTKENPQAGPGRPKLPKNRDIDDLALEKIHTWFGDAIIKELGGIEEMFEALVRRAFKDVNTRTGIAGNYHDTALIFSYMFGKPVTKIESKHTNEVEMFKAMMQESLAEANTIDVEFSESDDDA